ncbi:MAG: UPF0175 family protein [Planctomycetes bacterium]|nr:UPF0175 family protein [Planctomycetota bacterium]
MTITIPDSLAEALGENEREVLVEILVGLYEIGTVSLAYAADLLELDRIHFQGILKARGRPLNFAKEDLEQDIRTADWLCSR